MEIQVQGKKGWSFQLKEEGKHIELGRGLGFDSTDRTVSRRHVSFQLLPIKDNDESRVLFKVIGKNPIWVHRHHSRIVEIRVFKSFESGEMESGDMFCISPNHPSWFTLKSLQLGGEDSSTTIERQSSGLHTLQANLDLGDTKELEIQSIDISIFDPVRDFGFVVMGHEFECYPKKMIRHFKNWNWFIDDETGENSENDDDGGRKGKSRGRRKRKRGGGGENDDEEWTGESEEDVVLIAKARKVQGPQYSTRSKDGDRTMQGAKKDRNHQTKKNEVEVEEEEEEDEDETLGGFIVDEENVGEETESDCSDEEEEFEDEDDDKE